MSAEYPLRSIVDIRVESVAEFAIPAVVIATFTAFAIGSRFYIENPTWNWLVTGTCVAVCIFSLFGIWTDKIVIETDQGSVSYTVVGPVAEARGFALAIKLLTCADSPVGRWRSDDGTATILIEFESGPIEGLYKQIVQSGESTLREFGHWHRNGNSLQMLIMATDIAQNPRFGIDTIYEIEFLDVDHLRINGPDRENITLVRTSMELPGFEDVLERGPAAVGTQPPIAEPSVVTPDTAARTSTTSSQS